MVSSPLFPKVSAFSETLQAFSQPASKYKEFVTHNPVLPLIASGATISEINPSVFLLHHSFILRLAASPSEKSRFFTSESKFSETLSLNFCSKAMLSSPQTASAILSFDPFLL